MQNNYPPPFLFWGIQTYELLLLRLAQLKPSKQKEKGNSAAWWQLALLDHFIFEQNNLIVLKPQTPSGSLQTDLFDEA